MVTQIPSPPLGQVAAPQPSRRMGTPGVGGGVNISMFSNSYLVQGPGPCAGEKKKQNPSRELGRSWGRGTGVLCSRNGVGADLPTSLLGSLYSRPILSSGVASLLPERMTFTVVPCITAVVTVTDVDCSLTFRDLTKGFLEVY